MLLPGIIQNASPIKGVIFFSLSTASILKERAFQNVVAAFTGQAELLTPAVSTSVQLILSHLEKCHDSLLSPALMNMFSGLWIAASMLVTSFGSNRRFALLSLLFKNIYLSNLACCTFHASCTISCERETTRGCPRYEGDKGSHQE